MIVRKIGEAVADLESELWAASIRPNERFHMNRRLIDTRVDVKVFRKRYAAILRANRPSLREPKKREAHYRAQEDYRRGWRDCLVHIFEELKEESHRYPIPLRRDRDWEHQGDWRYCLYRGLIYQFDRPGYSDEEMIAQITALETPKKVEGQVQ